MYSRAVAYGSFVLLSGLPISQHKALPFWQMPPSRAVYLLPGSRRPQRDGYLLALDGFGGHTRPTLNYFKLRALRKIERKKKTSEKMHFIYTFLFGMLTTFIKVQRQIKADCFASITIVHSLATFVIYKKTFRISRCS